MNHILSETILEEFLEEEIVKGNELLKRRMRKRETVYWSNRIHGPNQTSAFEQQKLLEIHKKNLIFFANEKEKFTSHTLEGKNGWKTESKFDK